MIVKVNSRNTHKISAISFLFFCLFFLGTTNLLFSENTNNAKKYLIDKFSSDYVTQNTWNESPVGGDTIFISAQRTKPLRFQSISGAKNNPIVIINYGGQVIIDGRPDDWGALVFENCKHIKVTGDGHPGYKYGFLLAAKTCGLAFAGLSSDCEAGFIKINHEGFFGIVAKKDYGGYPPSPIPVFENLVIHDCFIENVSEGMYLGETKSPGMEFKHVRVYNNIVRHTKRECIQIANMVEDVEVYNNTLLNAGISNLTYQGNLFQIGDNTVARVYRNIMIGAATYGIINLGMGNNFLENNYISSCMGVFIDDRKFTLQDSLITLSGNFFSNISNSEDEVIRNMNGENYLIIENNIYDNENALFYRNYFKKYTNFELINNQVAIVRPIEFVDSANNNYALADSNPEEYMNLGAPGGPEYFDLGGNDSYDVPVTEQIILDSSMVTDEVAGGSVYSALYLVDEQSATPENEMYALSQSWKPAYNMNNGPYHVYIDLKNVYHLSAIALHDMHNTKNLDVSVGEPGNWEPLFTESCDKYKTWKVHSVDVASQYIRLSMNESVYAAVNELVVYGYQQNSSAMLKSAKQKETTSKLKLEKKDDLQLTTIQDLYISQNPVQDNLKIHLPADLKENFKIEVYNISGKKMIEKGFEKNSSSHLMIDVSNDCDKDGIYIMRYTNDEGTSKTLKFLKYSHY